MDALQLLSHLTMRQLDTFFETLQRIPADKIDWTPTPNNRSALDQLQEVAVVYSGIPQAVQDRKLEMTPEQYEQYNTDRKKVTDPAELERMTREGTAKLLEFMATVQPEELPQEVAMPWPGKFLVGDLLAYHYWNLSYHNAQISYIADMLEGGKA